MGWLTGWRCTLRPPRFWRDPHLHPLLLIVTIAASGFFIFFIRNNHVFNYKTN